MADPNGWPKRIRTENDAIRLRDRVHRDFYVWLDLAHIARDDRKVLSIAHESGVVMEYGFDALARYYAPTDPRLPSLDLTPTPPAAPGEE